MIGYMVGSYKIVEKIGEGGMGAVFKGLDVMLEREVAIKMLKPELASQPEVLERFRTEAVTLAKLNHPNIATLYNFMRQGNDFFMVMEFVRGQTIDNLLRTAGAVPVERAVPLFCQALDGINHAHRMGIIHRDIKPANMMLTDNGSIKVMDFGIARVLGSARMTRAGNVVGTIEYMSPEAVRGLEVDARSDVYSLGILLYEMLTGRVPFDSTSEFEMMKMQVEQAPPPPRTFSVSIPIEIEQAIMRALAKKPEARFQTAGEFSAMLLGALAKTGLSGALTTSRLDAGNTPPSGPLKQTRLGSNTGATPNPVYAQTGQAEAAQLKETRLGQWEAAAPLGSPTGGVSMPAAQPPGRRSSSIFQRLSWKHFLAAGVGVAVLASLPFVLMRSNPTAPQPKAPPMVEPGPAAEAPPPAAPQTLPMSNPVTQEGTIVQPLQPIAGSEPPPRPRSAGKSAEKRKSVTNTPSAADTAPRPQATAPPAAQPQPAPPVAAPGPDRSATAKTEAAKKPKEESNIIKKGFGRVKGFFDRKKKEDQ